MVNFDSHLLFSELESIGINAILMTLSQKYNIVLEVEDATPKNLRNLDSIVTMVERKVEQKNQGK